MPEKMLRNKFYYFFCFPRIVASSTTVINTISNILKLYAESGILTISPWESNELIPIELVIRKGDQRFVFTPVMPTKPTQRHPDSSTFIKDRWKNVKSLLNFLIIVFL